jgi:uncharacterized damage-inducible protein DinB
MMPWRFVMGSKLLYQMPQHVMLTDAFSHLAHHRGQLTVYLRMNDVSVPATYGLPRTSSENRDQCCSQMLQ